MKYDAFISYSHALDGRLAPALQLGLHRFTKPWYRLRAMRVFRDDTTLALTPALWPKIRRSLDEAGCLILMASPKAAQSEWVRKEVAHWIASVPVKPLLIVWTNGEVNWPTDAADFDWQRTDALPTELRGYFQQGPPLYLDLRWARNEKQLSLKHPQFLEAVGKLASGITGRDLQNLLGQEVTEHRRTRRVATLAIVVLTLALCAAIAGAIFALQGQERAKESLYFATIPAVQESSQRGDKIEALRLLVNAPERYRGWEWSFLKRRIGFAPMRLRHSQIAILDAGPLQGSGLRELADRMFDGAAGDATTAAGITVVNRGGGRGGGHIEVLTEEDEISVTTYQASSYGDFGTMCLSPDGSCLLVLTERMQEQTLAGDDFLPPPGTLDLEHDGALLHVLPVPAKLDTSQLGRRQPEAAENNAAEPADAAGEPGQGEPKDEALGVQAAEEEPASEEERENESVFFENHEGRLVCVHANGAREFVARPDPHVPGKARLRLRDRPMPLSLPTGDEEEAASTELEVEGALRLLTGEQREAVQSWHAAKPERLVLAIDWSDPTLPCLAVDPESEELSLIELRHPERVRTTTSAGTRRVWKGIRRMGDGAFDAGAAFSRDRNKILLCPFEDDRAAILDRATLKPLVFLQGEIMRANDHTARPGGSEWALSPAATFASLVAIDAPSATRFAGICRTDTGAEVEWTGVGEVTAVGWDSTEKLFATLDAFTNLITVRRGLTGAVDATAPAAERQDSRLLQEVPSVPNRILVGRTLFRRSDMRALLTLPDELALAPDWSWALMTEGGTPSGDGGLRPANGLWPNIELVERITSSATESSTVAEMIQSLQMTLLNRRNRTVWEYLLRRETEATQLKQEIREEALKTFAYRMKHLLAQLGWPEGYSDVTLGEVQILKNRAAGLHEEAARLLAERPDSDDAQFAVAACAFLDGEEADAARAAVESAHAAAEEGVSPEQHWVQLAGLMALDGRPAEIELGNEWMTRHAVVKTFRDGMVTPTKLLELLEGDSLGIGGESGMLEGLTAAAEWERGRKDRAAGWIALVDASGGFAHSQMPRMLEKLRGGESPYWFSLLPETTHEAFSAALAIAPVPEKRGPAILALARDYLAAGEKAAALYVLDRTWRGSLPFLERLESYRLACTARSVSEKEHVYTLAELVSEEETDVPPVAALEFYGRAAASGGESAAAFSEKALTRVESTPNAKRTAEELLGLVGARTALGDEAGAQAAFATLLRKEPAFHDEQVIEARAWTAGEARALGRHLARWLKNSAPPAPSPAETKLRDSRIALLLGKNAAALSAFHQALNAGAKPEPALWMRLIAAALMSDDAAGRLRLIERGRDALPRNAGAHAAAALARSMAGDTGNALAALREAVSLDARFGSIEGWNAWRSEIGAGGIEVETPMFTLLNARPVEMITNPTELLNAAKSRLEAAGEDPERQLRAADAALAFTAAAKRAQPNWNYPGMQHAELLRARVTALVRLRRLPEALAACQELVENGIGAEDFHLPFRLAFVIKQNDRARAFIDAGSAKLLASSEFARLAGHALLGLGDPAAALEAFERSRSLLSNNDEPEDDLLAGLALTRWLAGKRDEALSAAAVFHKQAPNGLSDEKFTELNWRPQEREALKAVLAESLKTEAAREES